MILLKYKVVRDGVEIIISEARGVGIIKVRYLIFTLFIMERMDMMQGHVGSHWRVSKKSRKKRKIKVKLLNILIYYCSLEYWHK